jgi:hypothetical protein
VAGGSVAGQQVGPKGMGCWRRAGGGEENLS